MSDLVKNKGDEEIMEIVSIEDQCHGRAWNKYMENYKADIIREIYEKILEIEKKVDYIYNEIESMKNEKKIES